jgi:hypothetical protein
VFSGFVQMFWHTDNYHLTLDEPQLKALNGKKLKINVRLGKLRVPSPFFGCAHDYRSLAIGAQGLSSAHPCAWP